MAATVAVFVGWGRMDLVLQLAGGLTMLVTAALLYAYSRVARQM